MSVDDKITMLFIAYPLGMMLGAIWVVGCKWYKKKQRKAENYLTVIGVYDE